MTINLCGKIQIIHLEAMQALPKYVRLANIHIERAVETRNEGWYAITPNGVAHGPYAHSSTVYTTVRQWLHNFSPKRDPMFWLTNVISLTDA